MKRIFIVGALIALASFARGQVLDPNPTTVHRARTTTTTVQPTTTVQQPVVAPRVHTNTQLNTQRNLTRAPFRNNVNANAQNNAQFRARHFDLQRTRVENRERVTFNQNHSIAEARNWQGQHYAAFRNYHPQWHDRAWWRSHHNRIVFVYGGWYYWDAGWWYPAWGYDPYAVYYYDGPIYAYNDLPPDQVIANVQASLQAQGYYNGDIDGVLGPLTRAAIAAYQADHGLYVTSAIDEPTLASLGMV